MMLTGAHYLLNNLAHTGLFFGGFYTSTKSNILTGQMSCPRYYFPLHFGEDMEVCVASDVEASTNSLKFGGFYSCSAGNPMAATKAQYDNGNHPKLCPSHYNQLMVAVDEDCIVNVCTDIREALQFEPQPPILPPFRHSFNLLSNASEVLMLTDLNGNIWIKLSNGQWEKTDEEDITTGQQLLELMLPSDDNDNDTANNTMYMSITGGSGGIKLSGGELAGIVIGSVVGSLSIVGFVLIAAGVGVRKLRKRIKSPCEPANYGEL